MDALASLRAIVGSEPADALLQSLLQRSGGDLQAAASTYFDFANPASPNRLHEFTFSVGTLGLALQDSIDGIAVVGVEAGSQAAALGVPVLSILDAINGQSLDGCVRMATVRASLIERQGGLRLRFRLPLLSDPPSTMSTPQLELITPQFERACSMRERVHERIARPFRRSRSLSRAGSATPTLIRNPNPNQNDAERLLPSAAPALAARPSIGDSADPFPGAASPPPQPSPPHSAAAADPFPRSPLPGNAGAGGVSPVAAARQVMAPDEGEDGNGAHATRTGDNHDLLEATRRQRALVAMGFDLSAVVGALTEAQGDADAALELLLSDVVMSSQPPVALRPAPAAASPMDITETPPHERHGDSSTGLVPPDAVPVGVPVMVPVAIAQPASAATEVVDGNTAPAVAIAQPASAATEAVRGHAEPAGRDGAASRDGEALQAALARERAAEARASQLEAELIALRAMGQAAHFERQDSVGESPALAVASEQLASLHARLSEHERAAMTERQRVSDLEARLQQVAQPPAVSVAADGASPTIVSPAIAPPPPPPPPPLPPPPPPQLPRPPLSTPRPTPVSEPTRSGGSTRSSAHSVLMTELRERSQSLRHVGRRATPDPGSSTSLGAPAVGELLQAQLTQALARRRSAVQGMDDSESADGVERMGEWV